MNFDCGAGYYFTPTTQTCQHIRFPVGVLRPDWLANATFLGETKILGKYVLAWTKADFIDYYADSQDCSPVSWYFHTMQARFDTVYYSPGTTVADTSLFHPPSYCNDIVREDHSFHAEHQ